MEIIKWLESLLVDYGAINVIIMLLTIVITNLIKKPIVNHADDFVKNAKKLTGLDVDKSVITSNIVYIPVGVSFVLYLIYTLIYTNFNFDAISLPTLISDSLVYGMLSMSIYEIGKAKLKSYIGKKTYKDAKTQIAELTNQNLQGDLLVQTEQEVVEEVVSETAEASLGIIQKEIK